MSAYGALAGAYDALLADGDYLRRGKAIAKALKKSPIPVAHVLDLGCGTGTIACYLAAEGYRVTATDLSEEMLTEAAGKAMGLEAPPFFLCQSMPKLRLTEPVDAVVSTLDSLNYLTRPSDLRETFRRVGRYLRPGGLFLFDVNTPYKLRRMDSFPRRPMSAPTRWTSSASGGTAPGTGTTRSTGSVPGRRRSCASSSPRRALPTSASPATSRTVRRRRRRTAGTSAAAGRRSEISPRERERRNE